jgi:splicing factor 3A subunit 1
MEKIAQGELVEDVSTLPKGAELASIEPIVVEDVGLEPPPPEFILDLPNISNIDL